MNFDFINPDAMVDGSDVLVAGVAAATYYGAKGLYNYFTATPATKTTELPADKTNELKNQPLSPRTQGRQDGKYGSGAGAGSTKSAATVADAEANKAGQTNDNKGKLSPRSERRNRKMGQS